MSDATKYSNKIKGTRVLIIGGSSGIGFGVAEACVENGCIVMISSSSPTRVESAVSKLQKAYPSAVSRISGYACDLGNGKTIDANIVSLFDKTTEGGKVKLDHVVHTAGDALAMFKLEETTLEKIQQAGMVRFNAPLLVARECLKHMNRSAASSFTITTGGVADKPIDGWAVIGSYAAGHHSMARGLALEMRPIRVNAISPGAVDTEMWKMGEEEKKEAFKAYASKMATGQVARVEDVVEAYLFVLKDRNVTASVINTNGGSLIM